MEFKNTAQRITKEDILNFENKFQIELPIDFKEHYLKYNGGEPLENWSKGDEFNFPFQNFLSIKNGENSIENRMKGFEDIGFDCEDKIVFASKGRIYTFFISVEQSTYGQIFVRKPKIADIREGTWIFHCNNFTNFLNGLNYIEVKKKV